jgi:dihydrofolate reductase
VTALKAQGEGTIAVLGSGVVVQALIEMEQVDEFRLFVHPLVLGTGKRRPLALQLVDRAPTSTGVVLLAYVLA